MSNKLGTLRCNFVYPRRHRTRWSLDLVKGSRRALLMPWWYDPGSFEVDDSEARVASLQHVGGSPITVHDSNLFQYGEALPIEVK